MATVRDKMQRAVFALQTDLGTIRTGRATPSLVDHIIISAYDGTAKMKLAELATVNASDARTLIISPFDTTQLASIEKGILEANIGLTPVVDASVIRLMVPTLTSERRQEYLKLAKAKIEGGRVMTRQIRHDVMAEIKRAFEHDQINEDEKKHLEKQLQTITDEVINAIDVIAAKKEQELLEF
ncbi:ribosome recycling factor [Candidatus Gottesmanbacteria bacterium]|nr:ribosome recycling factor [Candidatus Gottesmanbacteria bacterium]